MNDQSQPPESRLSKRWQSILEKLLGEIDQQFLRDANQFPGDWWRRFLATYPDADEDVRQAFRVGLLSFVVDHRFKQSRGIRATLSQLKSELQGDDPSFVEHIPADYSQLSPKLRLPERIGPYTVVEQLPVTSGQGCIVVASRTEAPGDEWLIKFAPHGTKHAGHLAWERKVLSRLNRKEHPHVIRLLVRDKDHEKDDDFEYLVLPWLKGKSLENHEALTHAELARIAVAISSALEFVHENGYLHFDLTCANIFVERRPEWAPFCPVLIDFGYAVRCEGGLWPLPDVDWEGGTDKYLAPEQRVPAGQKPKVNERTDIFQLGAVLGARALSFRAYAKNYDAFRQAIYDLHLPRQLEQGIIIATESEPQRRFQSASEMRKWFAAYEESHLQISIPTVIESELEAPADSANEPIEAAPATVTHRRGPPAWLAWAIAGVTVTTLLAVAWFGPPPFLVPDNNIAQRPQADGTKDDGTGASTPPTSESPPPEAENAKPAPPSIQDRDTATTVGEQPSKDIEFLKEPISETVDMEFALIGSGIFSMGSDPNDASADRDEMPQHDVTLTKPFYLGVSEVTVEQFQAFVQATRYETESEKIPKTVNLLEPRSIWSAPTFVQSPKHPVVNVSWNDAVKFCDWLGEQRGYIYRLPTEAEWEYAGRAGTQTRFNFGDNGARLSQHENVAGRDEYVQTAPVRSFPANAFGLHDMQGNVAEWCGDWYESTYDPKSLTVVPKGKTVDPTGPDDGGFRVRRGGSYQSGPQDASIANRNSSKPEGFYEFVGFRVVREVVKPDIVGQWKIVKGSSYMWSSPVTFNADGTSSLAFGYWNYRWNGSDGLELVTEYSFKPSKFSANNADYTWDAKLSPKRLELSQDGKLKLVLERIK